MPKFDFSYAYNGVNFADSIVLTDSEYADIGDVGVEAIKEQRIAAWLTIFEPAPAPEDIQEG